jgi:hypothetical protein
MRPKFPFEVICWCSALVLLYFMGNSGTGHQSLCPFSFLSIPCPGCGLGRAIHLLMHGEIRASFGMHWFGIPAFLILLSRILRLLRNFRLTLRVT